MTSTLYDELFDKHKKSKQFSKVNYTKYNKWKEMGKKHYLGCIPTFWLEKYLHLAGNLAESVTYLLKYNTKLQVLFSIQGPE